MFGARQNGRTNLEDLLIRLRHADRFTQSRILRELAAVVSEDDEEAISLLLEYVSSAIGIEICSKLFSVLAVAITNNQTHWVRVASCPDVYDAACRVLSAGLVERTVAVLGLLALLQGGGAGDGGEDEEGRGRVAVYAKGRVRLSGCLQSMSELFFKDIMYADTWRALCTCLATSCDGCEPNQTSCAHLLPACIEKCSGPAATAELLRLLQALVEGHACNQRLFLQCNGITIFTRKVLVRSEGSWLLKTLLEGSSEAARLAFQAAIPQILSQLCITHGRQSKVGQWCSVCLYHITTGLQKQTASEHEPISNSDLNFSNISEIEGDFGADVDDKNLKQTDFNSTVNREEFTGLTSDNINYRQVVKNLRNKPPTHTYHLVPNVKNNQKFLEGIGTYNNKSYPNTVMQTQTQNFNIQKKAIQKSSVSTYSQTTEILIANQEPRKQTYQYQSQDDKSCQTSFEDACATKSCQRSFNTDITEFIPQVSSTPLRESDIKAKRNYPNEPRKTNPLKRQSRPINSSRVITSSKLITKPKDTKLNQSLGSKLLRSFNATCDSVVQVFKGYFPNNQTTSMGTITKTEPHRSTSFADYMQKYTERKSKPPNKGEDLNFSDITEYREAAHSSMVYKKETQQACKTCNDTVVLQRKLSENQYLKDTVKKLKIGINLYGCNFKKIAKVYWKDDAYITSAVLYNLYRKLIVKKSPEK